MYTIESCFPRLIVSICMCHDTITNNRMVTIVCACSHSPLYALPFVDIGTAARDGGGF